MGALGVKARMWGEPLTPAMFLVGEGKDSYPGSDAGCMRYSRNLGGWVLCSREVWEYLRTGSRAEPVSRGDYSPASE